MAEKYLVVSKIPVPTKTFKRFDETVTVVFQQKGKDRYVAENVPEWVAQRYDRSEFVTISPMGSSKGKAGGKKGKKGKVGRKKGAEPEVVAETAGDEVTPQ